MSMVQIIDSLSPCLSKKSTLEQKAIQANRIIKNAYRSLTKNIFSKKVKHFLSTFSKQNINEF
jgi:hypothetical protein